MTKFGEAESALHQVDTSITQIQQFLATNKDSVSSNDSSVASIYTQYQDIRNLMHTAIGPTVLAAEKKALVGLANPAQKVFGASMEARVMAAASKYKQLKEVLDEVGGKVEQYYGNYVMSKEVVGKEKEEEEKKRMEMEVIEKKRTEERKVQEEKEAREAQARREQEEKEALELKLARFRERRAQIRLEKEKEKAGGKKRIVGSAAAVATDQAKSPAKSPAKPAIVESAAAAAAAATAISTTAPAPVAVIASSSTASIQPPAQAPTAIQPVQSPAPAAAPVEPIPTPSEPSPLQPSGPTVCIQIRSAEGEQFDVNISPDETVSALKSRIHAMKSHDPKVIRLLFRGNMLADDRTIKSYDIQDKFVVHMVVKKPTAANTTAGAASGDASTSAARGLAPQVPPTSSATPAPASTTGYPSGTVLELHEGADELNRVLTACGASRLVIVDWFASWCRPCQVIAPYFRQLAATYPNVSFITINTELTSENRALAAMAQVRAYPTFHAYRNFAKVGETVGANPTNLESLVRNNLTPASQSGASAPSAPSSAAPTDASRASAASAGSSDSAGVAEKARALAQSLRVLKTSCGTEQEFIMSVHTLLTFVKNIEFHPNDAKFRKVKLSNTTFQQRLGSKQGGVDCMKQLGFQEFRDPATGEDCLVMPEHIAQSSTLSRIRQQLEAAVSAANTAASSAAPRAAPLATGPLPAMNAFGGMGGMGGLGPDNAALQTLMSDPNFASVAQQLASNPGAMSELMEAQQAIQRGDFAALQRLQASPTFAQLSNAMFSNPAFVNAMASGRPGMMRPPTTLPTQPTQPPQPSQQPPNVGAAPAPGGRPNAPTEQELIDAEEEMLQRAIQMSLEEAENKDKSQSSNQKEGNQGGSGGPA